MMKKGAVYTICLAQYVCWFNVCKNDITLTWMASESIYLFEIIALVRGRYSYMKSDIRDMADVVQVLV